MVLYARQNDINTPLIWKCCTVRIDPTSQLLLRHTNLFMGVINDN